jgi:hypothetical protein
MRKAIEVAARNKMELRVEPKPYTPAPHPQQSRIDDIRIIPSLVTANPHFTPKGK